MVSCQKPINLDLTPSSGLQASEGNIINGGKIPLQPMDIQEMTNYQEL